MTLFDAMHLAPMWLSVACASAKAPGRPVLDRTISIEAFREGMRLTATDSYVLLTAWVPHIDHGPAGDPGFDAVPYATATAIDSHGRGRGLIGHAFGLAAARQQDEDPEPLEMSVLLGVVDEVDEDDRSMFAGMEAPFVIIELPGSERVKLRTYEGEYPNWRPLLCRHSEVETGGVGLSAERLGQMAKLAKYHPLNPLRFTFGGDGKPIRVEVTDRAIEGIVMPVATDVETGEPLEQDHSDDEDGDA